MSFSYWLMALECFSYHEHLGSVTSWPVCMYDASLFCKHTQATHLSVFSCSIAIWEYLRGFLVSIEGSCYGVRIPLTFGILWNYGYYPPVGCVKHVLCLRLNVEGRSSLDLLHNPLNQLLWIPTPFIPACKLTTITIWIRWLCFYYRIVIVLYIICIVLYYVFRD